MKISLGIRWETFYLNETETLMIPRNRFLRGLAHIEMAIFHRKDLAALRKHMKERRESRLLHRMHLKAHGKANLFNH